MPVDVSQTLQRALSELESEKERIDRQISAIRAVLGRGSDGRGSARARRARGRRAMSAAARRAVSQRMKAYWAARRAAKAKARGGKERAKAS